MIKNVIMYVDFDGKERMLPFNKEINGVDFSEIVSFTRINQEVKDSKGRSMTERYVIGVPYMYPNIEKAYCYDKEHLIYDKKHLINDILNNGRQVADEKANCYHEMLTGNICYKTSNVHVVSSQNELLRIMMKFIEENEQTIGREQKPASRTRR